MAGVEEEVLEVVELPVDYLVHLLVNPPLFQKASRGRNFLKKGEKRKIPAIKRDYVASLERVVKIVKKRRPRAFKDFLARYMEYFGEESTALECLTNQEVGYVLDALQFDKIMQEKKRFITRANSYFTH